MGKKSKKKALRTLESATMRDKPELPPGREWRTHRFSESAKLDKAIARRWQPRVDALFAEEKSKAIGFPKNEEEVKHKRKVIKMATDLIDDIDSVMARGPSRKFALRLGEQVDKVRTFIGPQVAAYEVRSRCFVNLEMYKECAEDCSKALQSGLTIPGTYYQVAFLMKRGFALEQLGRLDETIMDYRAALASFRLAEKPWECFPTLKDVRDCLFHATCHKKMGSPRPHFSDEERDSLLKDIGLGYYHKDKRKCLECGQQPTRDVPLSSCLGCRRVWFCNKACQTKAWKSGHKRTCKATIRNILVGDIY